MKQLNWQEPPVLAHNRADLIQAIKVMAWVYIATAGEPSLLDAVISLIGRVMA